MALATQADVEKALNRDLTSDEEEGVANLLDRASDLVDGYLQNPLTPPIPGPVVRVVAEMVAAVFLRGTDVAPDVTTQSAGPYSNTYAAGSTSVGPWLTGGQKLRLRNFRIAMLSMRVVGEGYA